MRRTFLIKANHLIKDPQKRIPAILEQSLGISMTGSRLYHLIYRRHAGLGWKEVVQKYVFGIAPPVDRPARKPTPYQPRTMIRWTPEQALAALKALHASQIPTHSWALQNDRTIRTTEVIEQAIGHQTSGRSLHDALKRHFGGISEAHRTLGLEPHRKPRVAKPPRAPSLPKKAALHLNRAEIIRIIQILQREGVRLNKRDLRLIPAADFHPLIQEVTDTKVSGDRLVAAAQKHFGRWYHALEAAGLDSTEQVRRFRYSFAPETTRKAIKAVSDAGLSLRPVDLEKAIGPTRAQYISAIEAVLHVKASPTALLAAGKRFFGSWAAALTAAKVSISETQRSPSYRFTAEKVIRGIHALHKNRLPLNSGSFKRAHAQQDERYEEILEKALGRRVAPTALEYAGRRIFKSWDEALAAAGLDPSTVRVPAPAGSHLANLPHQRELEIDMSGDARAVRLVGNAGPRAEEIAELEDLITAVTKKVEALQSEADQILQSMVQVILDAPEGLSPEALAALVSENLKTPVTPQDIEERLRLLKNPDVQDLLLQSMGN